MPMPLSTNTSLPFWRMKEVNVASWGNSAAIPKVTFAFEETSAAISLSSSQVHLVSSGISIFAFSKMSGAAKMHALLMPALIPTSLPSILPESTVPSANLETSAPFASRSRSAPRVPYSEM